MFYGKIIEVIIIFFEECRLIIIICDIFEIMWCYFNYFFFKYFRWIGYINLFNLVGSLKIIFFYF